MKRLWLLAALAVAISVEARGDQPTVKRTQPEPTISLGQMTPTPEMWFYAEQMRQHNDPHAMVRQKAEFERIQRQRRIAAQQWFGVSNARPTASITPFQSTYSPVWVGNSTNPMWWSGQGTPVYSAGRPRVMVW